MSFHLHIKKVPVLMVDKLSKNKEKYNMDNIISTIDNCAIPWIYNVSNYMKATGFMGHYIFEKDVLYIDVLVTDIKTYDGLNSGKLVLEEFITHFEFEEDDESVTIEIERLAGFLVCENSCKENGINRWDFNYL